MAVCGLDRRQAAVAVSDVQPLCNGIVADVVGILGDRNGFADMIVRQVDELDTVTLSIRDRHDVGVGGTADALRLKKSLQALEVNAVGDVDDFNGVISERRNEQALAS